MNKQWREELVTSNQLGRMEAGDVSKAAIRGTGREKKAGVRFPRHTAGVRRRGAGAGDHCSWATPALAPQSQALDS